jgi:carbon monoxide dehydrogenase subunit G
MKLGGSYEINAPRDKVFAAITDPNILQRSIEGCEKMVKTADDTYDAHLKLGVAGLKGSYVGKVQLKDPKAPESYTLVMEGKGAPGFVKGVAKINLIDKSEKTELRYEADVQVGGMIAAIGSRLIEAIAKKMADDFFKKFAQQI